MLHSQACDGVDSSDQDIDAQWGKLQVIVFSKTCYPNATRGRQAARCAFPTSPCGGSFGPASRRRRVTTPVATPPVNRMSQRDQRLHRLWRRPPGPGSATIAKTVGPVADRTLIDDDQRLLVVASSREDSPAEQALQIVRIRLSLFSSA